MDFDKELCDRHNHNRSDWIGFTVDAIKCVVIGTLFLFGGQTYLTSVGVILSLFTILRHQHYYYARSERIVMR